MKAIILAAGYATRLYPLTRDKPKHLLEVGGKPIIDYVIEGIETIPDIEEVYVVTNDRFYENFSEWCDSNQPKTRLKLNVLNDKTTSNEDRLGSVGDIWHTIQEYGIDDDLLIIAGDNLYYDERDNGYNLRPLYESFEDLGRNRGVVGLYDVKSLEVAKHMNQNTFSDDRIPSIGEISQIVKTAEKDPNPTTTLITVMIEAYPREVIKHLKEYIETRENHDKMGDFRSWLIDEDKIPVYGYHLSGTWFDIGLPEELEEARTFYDKLRESKENN